MNAKLVIAASALLVLPACHTMMENSSPYDYGGGGGGYTQTKNDKGETIHVRERPGNSNVPPVIYPVAPIYPSPIISNPNPPSSTDGASSINFDPMGPNSVHAFLEFARTEGNTHMGFHFGGSTNDVFMGRIGGSFFYSEELFLGLDFSGRAYIPTNNIKPFAGAGIYYGDTKKCKQVYSNGIPVERCEKKFLGAGYVELGLELQNFSVFWRDYNVTRAGLTVPTESFWGIGLRF